MLDERLGAWHFWLMFLGFGVGFFPMHTLGIDGMPRRIYTYHSGLGWDWQNLWITIGAFVFVAGVAAFFVNVFYSLRRGAPAGDNPWDAPTLEWATTSPPPSYNFVRIPIVASRHPLWEGRLGDDAGEVRSQLAGPALDRGRDTFGTSPLDATPDEVLRMPEDTVWPFALSVAVLVICYGLVSTTWWVAIVGAGLLLVTIVGWLWPTPEPATAEV
jgi:cytochrome c oxidase subunit 1/cytochrome c oxidase subunit I+III